MEAVIALPTGWINADKFEAALQTGLRITRRRLTKVTIRIPVGCKFLIEVILRLLSLCNQLIHAAIGVCLDFMGGQGDTMGYLDRIGFFEHLSPNVEVDPFRPALCASRVHRGGNGGLVEIERLSCDGVSTDDLIKRLEAAARRCCNRRDDANELGNATFYMFSELVRNVGMHSESELPAFAALQSYPNGNRLGVTVSDSGVGLLTSLRNGLMDRGSPEAALDDRELVITAFRQGLSRFDDDRHGNGLPSAARYALKYNGVLDLRLAEQRYVLRPASGAYVPSRAFLYGGLTPLLGTHIGFSLALA